MQTSKEMEPTAIRANGIQRYQLGFVLVVILMFLLVLFMSSKPRGLDKFEEDFFQWL